MGRGNLTHFFIYNINKLLSKYKFIIKYIDSIINLPYICKYFNKWRYYGRI